MASKTSSSTKPNELLIKVSYSEDSGFGLVTSTILDKFLWEVQSVSRNIYRYTVASCAVSNR